MDAAEEPGSAPVVLASNRGPLAYSVTDGGELVARRGGGGLVSGLSSAGGAVWVCAALSEGDRRATRSAPGHRLQVPGSATSVRMLDLDPATFTRAYSSVANSTLWFVHHLLYDTPMEPAFGARFARDWASYVDYNQAFADALATEAGPGAKVLVQDYHLTLAPAQLRALRPDLRIAHFSHTPWAPPEYFALLPDAVAVAVLEGVLGADRVGFHSPRWADAFVRCCAQVLGARVAEGGVAGAGDGLFTVTHAGRTTAIDVHPLGVDVDGLRTRAAEADVDTRLAELVEQVGDRRVIVRIDRTELSKNIVRGLEAYRELLLTHPEWRDRVVHLAYAYPSRHDLPVYREYTAAVLRLAREINDELGDSTWQPVRLDVDDDYPRSLAAFRLAEVLVVNPVRDGMNLVAKEGPVLAERGCALVLSREAGAVDELAEASLVVNPFDVTATAEAMHAALSMDPAQRRERSDRLAELAGRLSPAAWLQRQLDLL